MGHIVLSHKSAYAKLAWSTHPSRKLVLNSRTLPFCVIMYALRKLSHKFIVWDNPMVSFALLYK